MASPTIAPLTGDPEIDVSVPSFPKILPELTWLTVSATRVMAMGGLTAPIYPAKVKCLSLLDFIRQLDGRTALNELLAAKGELGEARRYYLRNLFQHGLLECGDGPEQTVTGPETGLSAFLARTLDQTRLTNRRGIALQSVRQPLITQGLDPLLMSNLQESGLNLHGIDDAEAGQFALLGIHPEQEQSAEVETLLARGLIVVPVHFRGSAVDIGPLLARQGGSRYADYRQHVLDTASQSDSPAQGTCHRALAALAAQLLLLLNARTSPLQLGHSVTRLSLEGGMPQVDRLPLTREQAQAQGLSSDSLERLERHARISVPALRYVGTKTHEVHYSPKNLAVAREVPVAAAEPQTQAAAQTRSLGTARLLSLIERAFGYRAVKQYGAARICPTGGNLGSPECLVLIRRDAEARLYRYIPVKNRLEFIDHQFLSPALTEEQIQVICLGNREKTTRKYNEFGENLACIDAGVALAYFKASAEVSGLHATLLEEHPAEPFLDGILASRASHYRLMWVCDVKDAGLGQRISGLFGARRSLDKRIAARKAHRLYSPDEVEPARVERLLCSALPVLPLGRRRQVLESLNLIVFVKIQGHYRLYVLDAGAETVRLKPLNVEPLEHVPDLFMQTRLSGAPVQMFFLSPLHRVLAAHGPQGHDISLSLAGEWVARLWLELAEHGLVGCPCGAAVEDDLLARLPTRYADRYNLFSFVLGVAAS